MRFKPRTDIERIIETVNTHSWGRIGRSILYKQLKELELNVPKASIKSNEDIEYYEEKYKKKKLLKTRNFEEEKNENHTQNPREISELNDTNSQRNKNREKKRNTHI